jgi:Predicted GTPase
MIGVVDFDDYRRATVADIPGLIEGAHQNLGLGHAFLRHITRCRLLLFVLDMAGSEGRNPIEDLQHLRREINLYDPRLALRPWWVVANKMDLPEAAENLTALRRRYPDREVVPVSAKEQEGIEDLKHALDVRLREPDLDKIRLCGVFLCGDRRPEQKRIELDNRSEYVKSSRLFGPTTRRSPFIMSKLVVASYCTTFLKSEMLHIYRQVTGPAGCADLRHDEEDAEHRQVSV